MDTTNKTPFIVFNTIGRAENWIKRQKDVSYYEEGCGCCSFYTEYDIYDGKVLRINGGISMGDYRPKSYEVMGRIKK